MNNFKELKVWKKAMELGVKIYKTTENFPRTEQFGLTSQIRRAAVSIPSNIAEGAGRISSKEFEHFLAIALGSSYEVETQIILSRNLGFIQSDEYLSIEEKTYEIQKMIRGLQKSLNNK